MLDLVRLQLEFIPSWLSIRHLKVQYHLHTQPKPSHCMCGTWECQWLQLHVSTIPTGEVVKVFGTFC